MNKLVLVCGSREWTDSLSVMRVLKKLRALGFSRLIHGACRGADALADVYGRELGYSIIQLPADWEVEGKAAGPKRNLRMLAYKPDLVVGFTKPNSKGTKHTLKQAEKLGLKVLEIPAAS